MRTILRRLLLLMTLMFWQGGFMFYGAVVVPVGSEVLGSDREQGFITQSVTNYLNGAGVVCLAVWCWELISNRGARKRHPCWTVWGLIGFCLILQFWIHVLLDSLLEFEGMRVLEPSRFRMLHQWYLILSTIQWACSILLTVWTLQLWQNESFNLRSN